MDLLVSYPTKISSEAKVNFIRLYQFCVCVCEIFLHKFLQGLGPLLLCWEFDTSL